MYIKLFNKEQGNNINSAFLLYLYIGTRENKQTNKEKFHFDNI